MNTHLIGTDVNRIDGPAKVSGAAKYAGEFFAQDMLYAVVVSGAIAHGEITSIDTRKAMEVPGAVEVFTHENRPHLPWFDRSYRDEDAPKDGSPPAANVRRPDSSQWTADRACGGRDFRSSALYGHLGEG